MASAISRELEEAAAQVLAESDAKDRLSRLVSELPGDMLIVEKDGVRTVVRAWSDGTLDIKRDVPTVVLD